jgi:hypothetical protein
MTKHQSFRFENGFIISTPDNLTSNESKVIAPAKPAWALRSVKICIEVCQSKVSAENLAPNGFEVTILLKIDYPIFSEKYFNAKLRRR